MFRLALIVTVVLVAGVRAEERTILGDATSGLTNLLTSSSPSAPYPPAPEYHPAPYPAPAPEYQHSAPYPAPAPAPYPAPLPEHHHEEHGYQHSIEPYTSSWNDHHAQHGQSGFTVQSGYEGLIVPEPLPEKSGFPGPILSGIGGLALAGTLLHKLLPFPLNKIALFLGTKIGVWVLGIGFVLLLAGAATTGVCAFTPICTISFLGFPFLTRESARSMFTHEKINMATKFVHDAIDKYNKINERVGKAMEKVKKAKKAKEQKLAKEAKELREKESARAVKEALKSSETTKPSGEAKQKETKKEA